MTFCVCSTGWLDLPNVFKINTYNKMQPKVITSSSGSTECWKITIFSFTRRQWQYLDYNSHSLQILLERKRYFELDI